MKSPIVITGSLYFIQYFSLIHFEISLLFHEGDCQGTSKFHITGKDKIFEDIWKLTSNSNQNLVYILTLFNLSC